MSKNFSPRFDPINLPQRLREGLQEADNLLERSKPQQAMANANLDMG